MKFCGMCGAQMPDEAVTCTNCGAPLQASQVSQQPYQQQDIQQQPYQQQPYQQQPYQQQPYQQQPYQQMGYQQTYQQSPVDSGAKGQAIGSLVCGIIGLVFGTMGSCVSCICNSASLGTGSTISLIFNLIGLAICIVGIVLGVKARNAIANGVEGRGMATAGFICSIIATVLVGIAVACSACLACSQCAACAGMGGCSDVINEAYNEAYKEAYNNYNW